MTNLWPNRLIYDAGLPEGERLTHTNINPYKLGDPLLPSGLLGPVKVVNARKTILAEVLERVDVCGRFSHAAE